MHVFQQVDNLHGMELPENTIVGFNLDVPSDLYLCKPDRYEFVCVDPTCSSWRIDPFVEFYVTPDEPEHAPFFMAISMMNPNERIPRELVDMFSRNKWEYERWPTTMNP